MVGEPSEGLARMLKPWQKGEKNDEEGRVRRGNEAQGYVCVLTCHYHCLLTQLFLFQFFKQLRGRELYTSEGR